MAGKSGEIWVCANCRSVNNARAKQCYNCRTPRDLAAVDPTQMETSGHGQVREVALPPFRSSRGRAVLASLLIVVVTSLQVVSVLISSAYIIGLIEGQPTSAAHVQALTNLGLASLVIAFVALVAWAAWLSRVVTEMPALGLGYPAATGLTAFVENFIPFFNLLRVPAIVRDVVRRVDPNPGGGEALISVAWLGIFAGYLIPRFGALLNASGTGSLEEALRKQLIVEGVATGIVFVGAAFLIILIWWIEARIARRRTAQGLAMTTGPAAWLQPTAGPRDGASGLAHRSSPPTLAVPDPVTVRSVLAATGASAVPGATTATREDAAPPGPHLIVTVGADGAIAAELGGETEALSLDGLHAAGEALYRAGGTATIVVTTPGDDVRAVARECFGVLSHAGVHTTLET